MSSSARFDLKGRTVIVTGVGRPGQIGHATALACAKAGAQLVLCDVNATGVAERAREFQAQGLDARPAAGDLTEPDIARLAVETALKYYTRLDAVINLAGGLTTWGPVEKITPRDIDRELAINLKTTIVMSQAAVEALAATRGAIVNVASIATIQPQANMALYTAAKAGIVGFTRGLAAELAPRGVRVNAIAPGMVRTPENVASAGPDAHYVEMEHITDGLLFLISDAAAAVTGVVLPITHGRP
jgi:NAD(P)-dependent dehydrogenase (short-subunit alcohol dehydrogenase family)